MSSFAIGGYTPTFFYTSNEMPAWYQLTQPSYRGLFQMNLGSLALDGYNAMSYNYQASQTGSLGISFLGAWQNFIVGLAGMVSSFGSSATGAAAATTGRTSGTASGNSGSAAQPAQTQPSGNGNGNNGDLATENERLRQQLAEKDRIIAEQQTRLDENGPKKG